MAIAGSIGQCRECPNTFIHPKRGKRELCDECRATHGPRHYKEEAPAAEPSYAAYHRMLCAVLNIKRCYR